MELKTNSLPTNHHHQQQNSSKSSKNFSDLTVVINYACLIIGSVAASLLTKFYFIHNGSSRWVSTWIQTFGFPLLLLPTFLPYHLIRSTPRPPFSGFTTRLALQSIFVGMFLALAFNLVFSVAMVKQKVTFTNLNYVILLTLSSVLLALSSSGDRAPGLTRRDRWLPAVHWF
ncbi:hypothetical protein C2S52_021636 [Perilla frutescens var. hirtella]|nr:hypothetical protein C2S52_021636 [Perilla frutescens var. hirtella]